MPPRRFIGVISDTHGLLRPQAVEALRGCEKLIHAGDVGRSQVLETLRRLAPVFAVRGNTDTDEWAEALPETDVVEALGRRIYLLHDVERLDLDPGAAGFGAVIFGHSHRPEIRRRDGVLYLNPGSAGPRRFDLPISVARLRLEGEELQAEILHLRV
jgi:hypothetical protein